MGVEVIGVGQGEIDGYGDNMEAFRTEHHKTSQIVENLRLGRKKNAFPAPYDPNHPDNQWPVMVYHPAKGELVVGKSLVGISDGPGERNGPRARGEALNKQELDAALKAGYRREPFVKPQVVVLDAATEKAALVAKNNELQGQVVAQSDLIAKMNARLEALESA